MKVGDYVKVKVGKDWHSSLQNTINSHPTGIFQIKASSKANSFSYYLQDISGESDSEIFKYTYSERQLELTDHPFDPSGLHSMLEEL